MKHILLLNDEQLKFLRSVLQGNYEKFVEEVINSAPRAFSESDDLPLGEVPNGRLYFGWETYFLYEAKHE